MTAPLPLMTESEVRSASFGGGAFPGDERGYGCIRSDQGMLPLKEMTVEARVIGTFAHTTLRQVFANTFGVPLEATYIFPLPDRAAVTRFTMEVAGRRIDGVLEERGQARRNYDAAIAVGKRASIAEEERAGVFTLRVGNLMPGEAATITLELTGALPVADGEVTYRFPLVVAPRYMPGQTLGGDNVGDGIADDTTAVPDASRISPPVLLPGMSSPVRLGITVELDAAGMPLSEVRSSLHAAYADPRAGRLMVRTAAGERLDRDFILRFRLGDTTTHTSARVVSLGGETNKRVFTLNVLPPTVGLTTKPKDVIFVIDRSGSMQGWKMVAARRATARMIDALRPHDRFSVLAFDNVVEELPLGSGLVEATDSHRFRATEWLAKVDARGGTEMAAPLARAADLLSSGYLSRDSVLVFVTDGQVGNEAQLLELLGQRLRGARVFALGVDQAVNAGFMNRLASLGRSGDAELVENEQRLDEVLARIHRRVDTPVLSELTLEVIGADLIHGSIAPSRLPDVFHGFPAAIFGQILGTQVGGAAPAFILRGRKADGSSFQERIESVEVANASLAKAWARLHLRDLEDRFDAGDRSLERKILEVSLDNSVLCRFTAFVAIDHAERVNRGGYQHQVTQPVESPAGWASGAGAMPSRAMAPPPMASPPPPGRPMPAPQMATRAREAPRQEPSLSAAAPPEEEASTMSKSFAEESDARAPKPSKPKGGGMLGAVTDALSSVIEKAKKPSVVDPPNAATFLPRLKDVLERMKNRSGDVLAFARDISDRLRLIVEDMAHANLSRVERVPLEALVKQLGEAVASGDRMRVDNALNDAERTLTTMTTPPPTAGKGREGFWR